MPRRFDHTLVEVRAARSCAGFTLIELLAVLVILGMVLVVSLGVTRPISSGHAALAAEAAVREGLERGRAAAMARGWSEVSFGERLTIKTGSPGGRESVQLAPILLPPGWKARWTETLEEMNSAGEPILRFDSGGASPDGVIELGMTGGSGTAAPLRLQLLGLSGQLLPPEFPNESGVSR